MAKKVKGGKASSKLAESAAPKFDHPVILPRRLDSRTVCVTVKLAAPVCSLLEFQLNIPPTTKISQIIERIIDQHGGSVRDMMVCVNRYHPEEVVAVDVSLEDCGVTAGQCTVYYDFAPAKGALLR